MAKYNEAFKLSVVQDYEPGQQGCKALANKYHLDHALVRRWVKSYEQHGLDGLRKKFSQYPFASAHLSDEDISVDSSEVTTSKDRVAVIVTQPLTANET